MKAEITAIAQEQSLAPVTGTASFAEDVKVVKGLSLVAVP